MADNWDPRKALDVTPDAAGFTCVGFAPSKGRRCHNPIAAHNRDAACALLDIIAELSLAAENLNSLFARLAPLVLCRRNHQGQATSMVSEWQRKVVALKRRNERASVSTIRTEVAPLYPAPTEARSVTYRSSLSQAGTSVNLEFTLQVTTRQQDNSLTGNGEAPVEPSRTTPLPDESESSSRNSTLRRSDLASPEPAPTSRPTPSVSSQKNVTRKSIEEDCSICFDSLDSDAELVWCKAQCGHNFHETCFEMHAAVERKDWARLTCPMCRTAWQKH